MKLTFFLFLSLSFFCTHLHDVYGQDKVKISKTDSLKKLLQTPKNDTTEINILIKLAQELRKAKEGQEYIARALEKSEKIDFQKGIAMVYLIKGVIARDSSLYRIAIAFYDKSIAIAENLPEKQILCEGLTDLGSVYRRIDEYEKSLNYYLRALQISEVTKDDANYGKSLNGVGNNYRQLKIFKEAIKYFDIALQYEKKRGNKFGTSVNLNNLGKVYFDLQEDTKAMLLMQEALTINQEMKNSRGISSCLNTIGEIHRRRKEYDKALKILTEAVEIDEKLGDRRYLIDSYINFGELYSEIGQYRLGISYIEKALKLAFDINTKSKIQMAYEHLYDIYKKSGDYQQALTMHEKAEIYKDSILNDKNQENIAKMQSMFDDERNQAKILLLEKDKKMQAAEANVVTNFMLAVVLFLLIIAAIFYRNILSKKKANQVLQSQNTKIQDQHKVIEDINQNLQASINYAKKIQESMLPNRQHINKFVSEIFIFFRPRDVVSGDFYWFHQLDANRALLACVDCTGHGVPGAFMSMLANALLSKIVENQGITQPNNILNELHDAIVDSLHQTTTENRDGMDMTICLIDKSQKQLQFAGAENQLLYIQNNELFEIKGDKMPIGGMQFENKRNYTIHTINASIPTVFYTFTDGYQDQFGGEKDKKFMIKRMKTIFLEQHHKPIMEQKKVIIASMDAWLVGHEQIDDMLVIGFRI